VHNGGKTIAVEHTISAMQSMTFHSEEDFRDHIKKTLANQLANKLIEENVIKFTYVTDPASKTITTKGVLKL
jgi:hypothetical protein